MWRFYHTVQVLLPFLVKNIGRLDFSYYLCIE